MAYCSPCDRHFLTTTALQQHRQTSSRHRLDYQRCQRPFNSHAAREQHVANSPRHNVCTSCPDAPDFSTRDELDEHAAAQHHCCTTCDCKFETSEQLTRHDVAQHNMCETCRVYFNSPSNLKNHHLTHAEKKIECAGCSRRFSSESAMVLHLEAGTCESGADSGDIYIIAFDCHEADAYTCRDDPDFDFECPTCETAFTFMSALLQHVESDTCDETLGYKSPLAKFLRYLRAQL